MLEGLAEPVEDASPLVAVDSELSVAVVDSLMMEIEVSVTTVDVSVELVEIVELVAGSWTAGSCCRRRSKTARNKPAMAIIDVRMIATMILRLHGCLCSIT